ncbi:hypothetical protein Tco_0725806 [Tanacetum coccineum]|uniref:Uncharacterized protein n=1 Tax=Tanacetum coccineum TaxID=301880 RepID=A0ABQ4YG48_9ASTR
MMDSLSAKPKRPSRCNSIKRYFQVRDIIKEVEDYLKTYSSAGMDISWDGYQLYGRNVSKNGRALNANVRQPHDS